jgi:hypothetical protein
MTKAPLKISLFVIVCFALGFFPGCATRQTSPKAGSSSTAHVFAAELPESKLSGPKLLIEDALSIARDYVQQHHIQVADSYIDSTRLDLNPGGARGKFWLVTWQRNEYAHGHPIKGGQFFMRIYMDRTVEVFYSD